ncbi:MAG TPA: hypothetical protein VNM14_26250 [Planctomycetota bacterium]|jgi:hypothetical protein|nr:hypothetical protein [Planctomycetota bacterium]
MRYASCFFSLGLALAAGCVADPVPYYQVRRTEPGGLSTDEIVKLAKAGTSDAIIIEKINSTGVAVKPTAEQLADLKKEGVSDAVLNAMTTAKVIEPKESVETVYQYPYSYPYYNYGYPYYYGYGPYWPSGYWYGYPYYGYRYHYYPSYYHSTAYPARGYAVRTYRH